MKNKLRTTMMGVACAVFGACAQKGNVVNVNANEFEGMLASDGVQLVDVRTQGEYDGGHIGGALNIDVKSPDFKAKAMDLLDPSKKALVYCRSGHRSLEAAGILVNAGFKVVNLKGGILEWEDACKPIKK